MARSAVKIEKMIALVSQPSELKSVFDQLRTRNVQVFIIPVFENAMRILESGVIDYCLLSVDYSQVDIYDLPQKIETETNVPVIAISELRDKQSMWRLTKVKTKNTLYSKANAQNIFSRVQLIKKAQQEAAEKEAQRSTASAAAKTAKQKDARRAELRSEGRREVESDTQSTSVVLIQSAKAADQKMRLLTPPRRAAVGTVKLTEDVKLTLVPVRTVFTEIQEGEVKTKTSFLRPDLRTQRSFFDRDVNYKTKKPLLLFSRNNDEVQNVSEISDSSSAQPENLQKVILGCLKSALSEFCNPDELRSATNEFNRSMVISVNSKNLVGTFIIAAETELPKLGDVQTQLYDYLRAFGFDWQQEEIKVELITSQALPLELITSGVYVSGFATEGEVAISYFTEAVKVPELGLTNDSQHVIDPKNLVKNTRLNFDVFLHLRVNSKDLHYLKSGSNIDRKQIERLKAKGLTPWVPRNQLSNLNEYVLLQRLLKFIDPDLVEDEIEDLLRQA